MQHILAPDFSFFEQPNCKSSEQRVALKLNCSGLSFEKLDRQTDIVFHLSYYNFLFLPTNVWCLLKFVPNESSIADVAKSGLIPRSCTHQSLSRAVYSISMILSQGKPFKRIVCLKRYFSRPGWLKLGLLWIRDSWPIVLGGFTWRSALGAPPRAKISETCHFQLFLLLSFQRWPSITEPPWKI